MVVVQQPAVHEQAGGIGIVWLVRLAFRLVFLFFVSLHHDWIDPVMREQRALRLVRQAQINEARRQDEERFRREQENLAREERQAQLEDLA